MDVFIRDPREVAEKAVDEKDSFSFL